MSKEGQPKPRKPRDQGSEIVRSQVDPHGTLATLRKMPHVTGVAGQFLLSKPVIAEYVLPHTHEREAVGVEVHGYTGRGFLNQLQKFHVEVTFPGKKRRHFLPAGHVRLPSDEEPVQTPPL